MRGAGEREGTTRQGPWGTRDGAGAWEGACEGLEYSTGQGLEREEVWEDERVWEWEGRARQGPLRGMSMAWGRD